MTKTQIPRIRDQDNLPNLIMEMLVSAQGGGRGGGSHRITYTMVDAQDDDIIIRVRVRGMG